MAALVVALAAAVIWFSGGNEYVLRKQMLARILGVERLPFSVSEIQCKSVSTTDLLWTCAFSIDATDFPALLAKECFEETESRWRNAHDYPMSLGLGKHFRVGHYYTAIPGCYSGGGRINVLATRDRSQALAHLYVE